MNGETTFFGVNGAVSCAGILRCEKRAISNFPGVEEGSTITEGPGL